jgi:hypothetical protein
MLPGLQRGQASQGSGRAHRSGVGTVSGDTLQVTWTENPTCGCRVCGGAIRKRGSNHGHLDDLQLTKRLLWAQRKLEELSTPKGWAAEWRRMQREVAAGRSLNR